ncbi:MAG: hypothetical protein NUW07_04055 [Candidatus Saccharicenans sp.]|jgi:hypothetical protein|nr:hypothetical protein [Candidatus Saccharicenans sp.]MDH7493258.1 hypothetical protein [Candidatus Saccharicenans sp.]
MIFGITSLVLIVALSLRLTFGRYLGRLPEDNRKITAENFKAYIKWIAGWKLSFLKLERWDRCLDHLVAWGKKNYPGWTAWVFYILSLCYVYLAFSGLIFAWLVPRGLYGYPLLLHVAAGALFAISLTIILFLKAREFLPDKLGLRAATQDKRGFWCPLLGKHLPRSYLAAVAFWVFAVSGFLLAASTLGSMLPYFNYPAQILFFNLHRWSALASVLAAILTLDVMIVD